MDCAAAMMAVEQACAGLMVRAGLDMTVHRACCPRWSKHHHAASRPLPQRPDTRAAGEATLLEFRNAPRPYEACQYILLRSADAQAQFQAVLALRAAALREWETLQSEQHAALLQFLVQQVRCWAGVRMPCGSRAVPRRRALATLD